MSQNANKTKVAFISSAASDFDAARRLYEELKNNGELKKAGLEPWLDKESILPGQIRSAATKNAIKGSRFFIALLSKNSVSERGDVQKQLKGALDAFKEFLESDIYIIPARLDDCGIPYDELKDIQYVDLFPEWEDGIKRILSAMNIPSYQSGFLPSSPPPRLDEVYWDDLIRFIDQKKCIPFIGPAASSPWISLREVAENWMKEYHYPFEDPDVVKTRTGEEDSYKLARVSQFLAIKKGERFPKIQLRKRLTDTLTKIQSPLSVEHPYSVLAELDLPIYITTNYDHLMEAALRSGRKEPKSEYCRWNEKLDPLSEESRRYQPTVSKPLVYHLHGDIDTPDSLVLTERDYFDFVIKMNKESEQDLFPTVICRELPGSSLMFVGYTLQDINFRAIFQGALSPFQSSRRRKTTTNVAVQIPPSISTGVEYLDEYATNMFEVHAYWGNIDAFVKELRERWRNRAAIPIES
jgi:hypothetical protein